MAPAARRDDETWLTELADVRERLARLETRSEAHDKASAERHGQLLAAVNALQARVEDVEIKGWKLGWRSRSARAGRLACWSW
jgi:flagellar motility protein MotE (MotC chaperone)